MRLLKKLIQIFPEKAKKSFHCINIQNQIYIIIPIRQLLALSEFFVFGGI